MIHSLNITWEVNIENYTINKEILNSWVKYFCDCGFAYNIQNSIPNFDDVTTKTNTAAVSGNAIVIPEYAEAYKIYCDKCFEQYKEQI